MRSIGLLAVMFLVPMAAQRVASAENYVDQSLGYSFTPPDSWKIVDPDVLEPVNRLAASQPQGNFRYACAFQPASHSRKLQFPYLLVQITSYSDGAQHPSFSEGDLKQLLSKITGFGDAELRRSTSPEVSRLVSGMKQLGQATYSTNPPGFQWGFQANTTTGTVRGFCVMLLGKDHAVSLNFYDTPEGWDQHWPDFQSAISSFHLASAQQTSLGSSGSWMATAGMRGAIAGGCVGLAVVVLNTWWLRRRAARKSKSQI